MVFRFHWLYLRERGNSLFLNVYNHIIPESTAFGIAKTYDETF